MAGGVGAGVDVAVGGASVGGMGVAVGDTSGGDEQATANKAKILAVKLIGLVMCMRSTSRIINSKSILKNVF